MNKKKTIGALIGVVAFIVLVAGATYAWFTWSSSNTILNGTTGCFTINYTGGTEINGSLTMSSTYTGGLSTTVKINILNTCTIAGTADIILNTASTTSAGIYADYQSKGSALKYAVVGPNSYISQGTITATGDKVIADNVELTTAATATTSYTVYIWLDGTIADNTYSAYTYTGTIKATATQNAG